MPDLPGCVSGGESLADAILMATDAASGWILDELEDGNAPPKASPLENIIPEPGGFVNMLVLDMDSYAKKYSCMAQHFRRKKIILIFHRFFKNL